MKALKVTAGIIGVGFLVLAGLMALTNPKQASYENFATDQLTAYLEANGCDRLPFGLEKRCPDLVRDNQGEIRQYISKNTRRQDFIFFSIYTTELSIKSLLPPLPFFSSLPSYQFKSFGAFQNFYIYEQRRFQE